MAWLCWLDALGNTAAGVTDHFYPSRGGFLPLTMPWVLSGSDLACPVARAVQRP